MQIFDGQTLIKCEFLEGRLPKYFFQEMCSSGGKQIIHKVSAAFIVRNCHPRISLNRRVCTTEYTGSSSKTKNH